MLELLLTSLLISVLINSVLFLFAYFLRSDKLTDVTYALSFITLTIYAFCNSQRNSVHIILVVALLIWAIRLGGFLLYRVIKRGKDNRFDGVREHFVKFAKFWIGQAITVWVLMIPSIFLFDANSPWSAFEYIGLVIFLAGFGIESIADLQKIRFREKDRWIDSGLWKYSRHPNYFGEITIWIGIYLYALPSLSGSEPAVGLISPVAITLLLLFISGVPILEKSADRRWGNLKSYQKYKQQTSILVPLPQKKS